MFLLIVGIILFVLILAVIFFNIGNISDLLKGIDVFDEKGLQMRVEDQVKELDSYYNEYCKDDCDPYRASVLIAKAITFLWKDCYKQPVCEKNPVSVDPISGYFMRKQIKLTKKVDCKDYSMYISGWCTSTEIGTDKTDRVDEWTVTIWGLAANTRLCEYKLPGENKIWGNNDCKYEVPKTDKNCDDRCSADNRISLFQEQMVVGQTYNIQINYNKDSNWFGWTGPKETIEVRVT